MKKYKVEITETLQKIVEIEADSLDDAIAITKEKYFNEEIVLDETNYIDTEIEIFDENK